MFAIAFDMVIADLKQYYGDPYNNAYFEIRLELRKYKFIICKAISGTRKNPYFDTDHRKQTVVFYRSDFL
jgi:virulence-associated protein VapD